MLALLNGIIHTLDKAGPCASAILIREDRIVSLGDDSEILSSADASVQKIDLQGRTVVPGFIDAHVHLLNLGLSLRSVNLDGVPSIRGCVDRVKKYVDRASSQSWVTGLGWNYTIWKEARFPHRNDLDEISPSHPVVLTSKNGHQAWCNSAALLLADIRKKTPDPLGGRIEREPDGEPTGVLSEEAIQLVTPHIPDPTHDVLREAYLDAQRMANARGLTGFHDCDAHGYDGIAMREMLEGLHRNDRLTLRAVLMIPDDRIDEAIARAWRTGDGSSHVRVGPVKVFADGALGPRTADMLDPYEGEPQNRGMVVTEEGRLFDLTAKAHSNGLQLAVHAIGDRAVRRCLDAFERSLRTTPGISDRASSTFRSWIPRISTDSDRSGSSPRCSPFTPHLTWKWPIVSGAPGSDRPMPGAPSLMRVWKWPSVLTARWSPSIRFSGCTPR